MREYRMSDGTVLYMGMNPVSRQICDMLNAGASADFIQERLGVDRQRIHKWNRRLGNPPLPRRARKRGIGYGNSVRVKNTARIAKELRAQGLTYRKIGEKMGLSHERARQLATKL